MPAPRQAKVELKVSLLGQGAITALAIMVLAGTFYARPDFAVFAVMLVGVALVWAWLLHRMNRLPWRRILISPDGQVVLVARDRHTETGRLAGRPVVAPFLICFSVRIKSGQKRRLWVFPDSTDGEGFRRLGKMLGQGWKES